MKKQEDIESIYKKIEFIKTEIQKIGHMRPGSINEQFKDPKEKTGSYYQLNYTHKMKTYTDYVRKAQVSNMKKETSEYKKLKEMIEEWIELSISASKLRIKIG